MDGSYVLFHIRSYREQRPLLQYNSMMLRLVWCGRKRRQLVIWVLDSNRPVDIPSIDISGIEKTTTASCGWFTCSINGYFTQTCTFTRPKNKMWLNGRTYTWTHRKWIQIVVCNQIWPQILFKVSNASQNIIGVVVNIDWPTQMIHRQAIVFIDHDFFLIRSTYRKIRNILFASNIRSRTQSYTTKNTVYTKKQFT